MSQSSKDKSGNLAREIYEPLYDKKLSDKEVSEIESNLKAFGKAILMIAGHIRSKPSSKQI